MTIHERSVGDMVVLDVEGSLSANARERLLPVTVQRCLRQDRTRIVINMQNVPYIDSTGLADIVEVFHATRRRGGALKLAHLTPHVRELLTVTTLLKVLDVFDSEADALAGFGVPAA